MSKTSIDFNYLPQIKGKIIDKVFSFYDKNENINRIKLIFSDETEVVFLINRLGEDIYLDNYYRE